MKYFEVLYKNCFGNRLVAVVSTINDNPTTPTLGFNFNWNGNQLVDYKEIDFNSFRHNIKKRFSIAS